MRALAAEATARTVVWLDEIQRYLDHPDRLLAGTVRALIAAGVVLVGTLWPHEYSARTSPRVPNQPDPYANDRELLGMAQVLGVPDSFTPAERSRAESLAGDRRIRMGASLRE